MATEIKGFLQSNLKTIIIAVAALVVGVLVALLIAWQFPGGGVGSSVKITDELIDAAVKTYVPPGQLDEYYLFNSGGHSGHIYVVGVPSMRHIRTIPVFSPDSATGYGWTEKSKTMMGDYDWGDAHHPALSETKGDYDGRWLFINDNANSRAARVNLDTFTTEQILGPVPNLYGPHGAAFITPNTEYFMMASRFSGPVPIGTYAPLESFSEEYFGCMAAIAIDPQDGTMSVGWELLLPPWSFDLSDAGKKVSEGWCFLTCYNSEEAYELLEENASQNERDYIVAVNWKVCEQAAKDGKYKEIDGVKVVDPREVPGAAYLVPCAKSPHGVDVSPDGKYFIGAGKLAPICTVFGFDELTNAIAKNDFQGEEWGLSVVNYDSVRVAEVEVGIGPLHTQFDDKGFAYTTLFIDSQVCKWSLKDFTVVDKVDVHYSPGHLSMAEGDTCSPDGKYLVSLNKLSKDKFLPVGPSHPESMQLVDLTNDKMQVIFDAPIDPEPHYSQMIKADKIKSLNYYPKDDAREGAVYAKEQARIERNGTDVTVYMMGFRSRFYPERIDVNQGDHITVYYTNTDFDEDITHGLAFLFYNMNVEAQPGETVKFEFTANKAGVYPFYCTNFCSALHQEMQGNLLVLPNQ